MKSSSCARGRSSAGTSSTPRPLPPAAQSIQVADDAFDIYGAGPADGEVVLPRLAASGYRSIAAVRRTPTIEPVAQPDRAAQVLAIADALQLPRFHLAGAQLAWDVAKRAPERVISVATTSTAQASAIAKLADAAAACSGELH